MHVSTDILQSSQGSRVCLANRLHKECVLSALFRDIRRRASVHSLLSLQPFKGECMSCSCRPQDV